MTTTTDPNETKTTRDVPISFRSNGHVQPHHPLDNKPRGFSGDGRSAVLLVEAVPADITIREVVLRVKRCAMHDLDTVGWRIPWQDVVHGHRGALLNYRR